MINDPHIILSSRTKFINVHISVLIPNHTSVAIIKAQHITSIAQSVDFVCLFIFTLSVS